MRSLSFIFIAVELYQSKKGALALFLEQTIQPGRDRDVFGGGIQRLGEVEGTGEAGGVNASQVSA